jgi:hypothetical protein
MDRDCQDKEEGEKGKWLKGEEVKKSEKLP